MHFKRYELKYYVNDVQITQLQRQLSALMELDSYSLNEQGYPVRSLYFDSIDDECLYQKQSGLLFRNKIRLRTYGTASTGDAKFEIKRKYGALVKKDSTAISRDIAAQICNGDYHLLLDYDDPILDEIYTTFMAGCYRPKVIVEYQRVALTLPFSNIRVTFDLNLRSNINHLDLFSNVESMMPVILEGKQILEIKYDEFFPGYLKKVIAGVAGERMAISKYTLARRFHKVQKWEDN